MEGLGHRGKVVAIASRERGREKRLTVHLYALREGSVARLGRHLGGLHASRRVRVGERVRERREARITRQVGAGDPQVAGTRTIAFRCQPNSDILKKSMHTIITGWSTSQTSAESPALCIARRRASLHSPGSRPPPLSKSPPLTLASRSPR